MLNKDYKEILQILLEEKVNFIIVGAYALAVHGYPRATGDIDIWVETGLTNAKKLIQALRRFGTPLFDVSEKDFEKEGIVFQIGVSPRRIDILTAIDGVTFQSAYKRRKMVRIDDLDTPVISFEDLIKNKESTGREKDILDVSMLKSNQKTNSEFQG